jgi:hypothetical protein
MTGAPIICSGRLAIDLASGRALSLPEVPAAFLEDVVEVFDIVGSGIGFVLDRDPGREDRVFIPSHDALRDLVEFIGKSGPFAQELQKLLDDGVQDEHLQAERKIVSPDSLGAHSKHRVLLLALPLEHCTIETVAGRSS